MPSGVTETNGGDSYSVSYGYSAAGDRETATYATPQGTRSWGYYDYVSVGDLTAPSHAFQTMCRLDGSGARTQEEFHYAYDGEGRLVAAAFAQSPYRDGNGAFYTPATGGSLYDATHPASRRAVSLYAYDAGGRLAGVATSWQAMADGGSSYGTPTALFENDCAYETSGLNRGLKTSSVFTLRKDDASYDSRTQTYSYDHQLDYLTSADYGDGNPNQTPTWSYDAAGNRNDSVVDNLNRATSVGGDACTNDFLGNRQYKGGQGFDWDCLDRMTAIYDTRPTFEVKGTYAYRADGMRVEKETSQIVGRYRYDGQMPVEDVETPDGGRPTITRYALGARGVDMMERTYNGTVTTGFPVYDAHGNNVASLSGSGGYAIADRRTYDAWGVVRSQQSGGDPSCGTARASGTGRTTRAALST